MDLLAKILRVLSAIGGRNTSVSLVFLTSVELIVLLVIAQTSPSRRVCMHVLMAATFFPFPFPSFFLFWWRWVGLMCSGSFPQAWKVYRYNSNIMAYVAGLSVHLIGVISQVNWLVFHSLWIPKGCVLLQVVALTVLNISRYTGISKIIGRDTGILSKTIR